MCATNVVNFRLDLPAMSAVLCAGFQDWTPGADAPQTVTPSELEPHEIQRAVRESLYARGTMTGGWAEGMGEREREAWVRWSHRQILKVWPGLAGRRA